LSSLASIYDDKCSLCPLHDHASHICVPGEGNEIARVFLIGEAPGRLEDDWGRPFVGQAGCRLDGSLKRAFKTDSARALVFITNVVKCRPPANRDPEWEEIETCSVYLKEELRRVNPQIIVTLGKFALQFMTGFDGVMEHRGTWMYAKGRWLMPTIHPAATLYNPSLINLLDDDLTQVAEKVETL
jgi:uracil-DNA glycosylase